MAITVDQFKQRLRDMGVNPDQYTDWAINDQIGNYNNGLNDLDEQQTSVEPQYQKDVARSKELFSQQKTDNENLMNRMGVFNSGATITNREKINKNESDNFNNLTTEKNARLSKLQKLRDTLNSNMYSGVSALASKYRQADLQAQAKAQAKANKGPSLSQQKYDLQRQADSIINDNVQKGAFYRPIDLEAEMFRQYGTDSPLAAEISKALNDYYGGEDDEGNLGMEKAFRTWNGGKNKYVRPWWK